MSQECRISKHAEPTALSSQGRRDFLSTALIAGAGLLAAPLLTPSAAMAATPGAIPPSGYSGKAYEATSADSGMLPVDIERRGLRPDDVLLDILYCGVCHSDIHTVRSEWPGTIYPSVPGHEIVGRVRAVGAAVTKFKVGDIGGVGCMVDSCGVCANCKRNLEQYCLSRTVFTYNSLETGTGKPTLGGYSNKIVVTQHFVIRIPEHADLAATAPLLCAGVTTFSPMQHWNLESGQKVGIVGLGGLGHMAVKLAASRKAEVIVFTTSSSKLDSAKHLGAKEAVLWSDTAALQKLKNSFDLIISTVPQGYPMQPFMNLLKLDGTLVNVGALEELQGGIDGMALAAYRRSLAGSMIGGIAETQSVIDYCSANNIKADIELIQIQDINRAFERVVAKDVRYRFVIDMASLRGGEDK
jgi:alcohol dehydrogenase (NADP+)